MVRSGRPEPLYIWRRLRKQIVVNADIEAGYSHSIALCMNVAAIQTGQKVTFDDATQQVMVGGKAYA